MEKPLLARRSLARSGSLLPGALLLARLLGLGPAPLLAAQTLIVDGAKNCIALDAIVPAAAGGPGLVVPGRPLTLRWVKDGACYSCPRGLYRQVFLVYGGDCGTRVAVLERDTPLEILPRADYLYAFFGDWLWVADNGGFTDVEIDDGLGLPTTLSVGGAANVIQVDVNGAAGSMSFYAPRLPTCAGWTSGTVRRRDGSAVDTLAVMAPVAPIAFRALEPGESWGFVPDNGIFFAFFVAGTDCAGNSGAAVVTVDQSGTPCVSYASPALCREGKVGVCHVPPGNPGNEHLICVGEPAVRAHLDHGDRLGACCP